MRAMGGGSGGRLHSHPGFVRKLVHHAKEPEPPSRQQKQERGIERIIGLGWFRKTCRISGGKRTGEGAFPVQAWGSQMTEYNSEQLKRKNLSKAAGVLLGPRKLENQACSPQQQGSSRKCENHTAQFSAPLDAAAG